jgi:hypothetical protein
MPSYTFNRDSFLKQRQQQKVKPGFKDPSTGTTTNNETSPS